MNCDVDKSGSTIEDQEQLKERALTMRRRAKYTYIGETDSRGWACGKGVIEDPQGKSLFLFTKFLGSEVKYEGSFLDDKLEGKCIITIDKRERLIAEFKGGKYFGKSTFYHDGHIYNSLGQEDEYTQRPIS